jgi:hypothetical protein
MLVYVSTWFIAFLLMASVLLVLVGVTDMAAKPNTNNATTDDGPPHSCRICGEQTSYFQLQNCTPGISFIMGCCSAVFALVVCFVGKVFIIPQVFPHKSRV